MCIKMKDEFRKTVPLWPLYKLMKTAWNVYIIYKSDVIVVNLFFLPSPAP